MTDELESKGFEAFESLVRFFVRMAYLGAVLMLVGIVLGIALQGSARLVAPFMFGIGVLMVWVGRRVRRRGQQILAAHREPDSSVS
jgi:hypothetical protein